MTIIKWDPIQNISRLQGRINRLFDEAFPGATEYDDAGTGAWSPAVDIHEAENAIFIHAELPGVRREDISIEFKDVTLSIQGTRQAGDEIEAKNYYRRERRFGRFHRSFTLPSIIDPGNIRAKFKDGVLEIEIPKPEEKKPKRIVIKTE
jgi:HSP20 family protein